MRACILRTVVPAPMRPAAELFEAALRWRRAIDLHAVTVRLGRRIGRTSLVLPRDLETP